MAHVQYKVTVSWDPNIVDVGFMTDSSSVPAAIRGLAINAIKITAGAPATPAGVWSKGAIVQNAVTGLNYQMNGSTASPTWTVIDTAASGFSLPIAETDSTTTTGTSFELTFSALTTGIGQQLNGSGATLAAGGIVQDIAMGAAIAGQGQVIATTGVYTDLNGIWHLIANAATTGTIGRIDATGLTSGNALYALGGGAHMISGGNVANFDMGAGIAGSAVLAQTSGVYVGTDGVSRVSAAAATSGHVAVVSAPGLTSGIAHQAIAAAATLTTGRYYSAFDGATEVFGIGANGHIHSTASAVPPTIGITTAQGITAVALTAGASDTCGVITSTGTQNNTGDSTFTLTFGKTYTVAPKGVVITAANASAALAGQSGIYVVSVSATAVVFGVPKSSAAGATPSWHYAIIA